MTRRVEYLSDIADTYDAIVFDQWGVLHNGSTPYPHAVACINTHRTRTLAVLSNSGKRSGPNAARIADMGFDTSAFQIVMTSGEALWRDMAAGTLSARKFFPIERAPGDAATFTQGHDVQITDLASADAVLLMGLPDGATLDDWQGTLDAARARGLPIYCSNPDRKSPRGGGVVISPGALAFQYKDMGGAVVFYGKPHLPIFSALQSHLGAQNLLMIGDSLEHDIAGATAAGWDSLFLSGGLYQDRFSGDDWATPLSEIAAETGAPLPTYIMDDLR